MFKRKRRSEKRFRESQAFKERTYWPQRGFSCAVGGELAMMIEEGNPIGYLMWLEISRPHAASHHSHHVIAPSQISGVPIFGIPK
jgi:hypothetical protein